VQRMLGVLVAFLVLAGLALVGGYSVLKWQSGWQAKKVEAAAAYRNCASRYGKYRNYGQYHASLKIPYGSTVPQQEWARRYRSVHFGMSENEVERIMGVPDYAQCGMSKEGTRFPGSFWSYQVEVQEDNVNYSKNSWIEIFFGPDGRFLRKGAINIQGIPNQPRPGASRD
jgi:hypothetical protein